MRSAASGRRAMIGVGHDIGMQKEQIEARQPQPLQTRLDRLPQDAFDLVRRRLGDCTCW
jgi:hypothetical protein